MRGHVNILFLSLLLSTVSCTGNSFKAATSTGNGSLGEEPVPAPTPTPTPVPTPTPIPEPLPSFVVGYNEAWFGPNFQNSFTDGFNESSITKTMTDMKDAGAYVVRLWLFQNRQGLVLTPGAPKTSTIDPLMLSNLTKTMAIARALNIKIYFTLWDGNAMPKESSELRDYYYNLLNNKYGEGDAFNTYVLTPLLALFSENQDVIYALDLMNEIEAPIDHNYWTNSWNGPRNWMQNMRNYVKARASWIKVTSSAGWSWAASDITRGLFSNLGLDFYDLHVYDDNGNIPSLSNLCATASNDGVPIILGEFGQSTKNNDDNLQKNSTERFLNNAKNSCFSGALAWRFDANEETWRFQRPDGSFRPAVEVIKNFR